MGIEVKTLNYIDYYRDFEQEAVNRIKDSFSWFDESDDFQWFYMRKVVSTFCLGECCENGSYTGFYFSGLEQEMESWSEAEFSDKFGDTVFTLEQVIAVFKEVLVPLFKEAGFEDMVTFWVFW